MDMRRSPQPCDWPWFFAVHRCDIRGCRDGDYHFREILLTRNYDEALTFLGYSPARFHAGFDSLSDIFEYVAGSAYFNRNIFLLENRSAQSRIRDRKRKTYAEFLKFCEAHPELPGYAYPERKADWLPRIEQGFPAFKAEHDKALADLAELRAVKAKFNGEWVSQLTGLQGKELGWPWHSGQARRRARAPSTPRWRTAGRTPCTNSLRRWCDSTAPSSLAT